MKKNTALALQAVLVLIGIAALTFLLLEPRLEGRNANATVFETYFHDPFLAYAYLASIPFFIALFHAIRILGRVQPDRTLASDSNQSLRRIKHCALATIGLVALGEILLILLSESDDRAGGVFMGGLIILGAAAAAFIATRLEARISARD